MIPPNQALQRRHHAPVPSGTPPAFVPQRDYGAGAVAAVSRICGIGSFGVFTR